MNPMDKLDRSILDEARTTNSNTLTFAAAILECDGKPNKIAHYCDEYGDGDGEHLILEFVRRCRRSKALKPGERLRAVRFTITADKWIIEQIPIEILKCAINARDKKQYRRKDQPL